MLALAEGSTTGVAWTTTDPPFPPGVNVIEVEGIGGLGSKVPTDGSQFTVFGTPFVTTAVRVTGWPIRNGFAHVVVLSASLYWHCLSGESRITPNAPGVVLKSVPFPPPE